MVDSYGETSESASSSSPAHDRDGLDVSTPNVARMYDFYLGGKDNYAADREAALRVLAVVPEVPMAALENREFLRRALRFLVKDAGIRQFIDIGPGLPTQSNVHHVVQGLNPAARVIYADNDPVVLMRSRSLLHHVPGVAIVKEDLRRPGRLLGSPGLEALIDFDEPVALCMTLVLQFIPDSDDPYSIVACLRDALCLGSYVVISHVTTEGRDDATLSEITDTYNQATAPLVVRSRDEIARFFEGLELTEPGVVFLSQWRPSSESYPDGGTRWAYGGVGHKTGGVT